MPWCPESLPESSNNVDIKYRCMLWKGSQSNDRSGFEYIGIVLYRQSNSPHTIWATALAISLWASQRSILLSSSPGHSMWLPSSLSPKSKSNRTFEDGQLRLVLAVLKAIRSLAWKIPQGHRRSLKMALGSPDEAPIRRYLPSRSLTRGRDCISILTSHMVDMTLSRTAFGTYGEEQIPINFDQGSCKNFERLHDRARISLARQKCTS